MNDHKLLELAAKAGDINVTWVDTVYEQTFKVQYKEQNITGWKAWNPLADDGDALRLAVKLNLLPYMAGIMRMQDATGKWTPDIYSSTRRAIVRAAAEIGKAMAKESDQGKL